MSPFPLFLPGTLTFPLPREINNPIIWPKLGLGTLCGRQQRFCGDGQAGTGGHGQADWHQFLGQCQADSQAYRAGAGGLNQQIQRAGGAALVRKGSKGSA